MTNISIIATDRAPAAIGPYSQAVRAATTVYASGQIGLDPLSGNLVSGGIEAEARQAFTNLAAVAAAAGGSLGQAVKLTLYLTDLGEFSRINALMAEIMPQPYPARSTVGVASLPRGACFEVDAVFVI